MAEFTCSKCSYRQTVPDEHVGKKTKCPKCRESGSVGESVAAPPIIPAVPNSTNSVIVLRSSGGSIQTQLSHSIRLNPESSLQREFITIFDKSLPAGFTECVGVTTLYEPESEYSSGQYLYSSNYTVKVLEDIYAIELRFLLFNIWGRHVQTLNAIEIADIAAGSAKQCNSKWQLFDENEACEYYASIAYVATIRTAAGQVVNADPAQAIAEAQQFTSKFSDSDLEPSPRSH